MDTVRPDPEYSLSMECYCAGVQADPDAVRPGPECSQTMHKGSAQVYRQALDTVRPGPGHSLSMERNCTGVLADPGCGTSRPRIQPINVKRGLRRCTGRPWIRYVVTLGTALAWNVIAQVYWQTLDAVRPDPGYGQTMYKEDFAGVQAGPGCGTSRPRAQPIRGLRGDKRKANKCNTEHVGLC